MRKHLYLIVEHEDEDREGGVSITDHRLSKPLKNEVAPIHVLDEDEEDFRAVGKQVGLGYADFKGEDDYEERVLDVMKQKLAEVDEQHLDDAGIDPEEVFG